MLEGISALSDYRSSADGDKLLDADVFGADREAWHKERKCNSKSTDPTLAWGVANMVGCSLVSPWRIQTDPEHKPKLTTEWLIEDWKPVPTDEELLAFATLFNMAMW